MRVLSRSTTPLLDSIDAPAALRELPVEVLPTLAAELREFLIQSVSRSGGHLSAGLGTVELAIALHYVFDTPNDALVWDVGHQSYPHKILTGRRHQLHTIRRRGGLAGFCRRDESEYDSFGAGHSSTSISAALGMSLANARLGSDARSVAIIGDGALTAGMAYEALSHAGSTSADLTVILNDNEMSISPNVGALSASLSLARKGKVAATRAWFEALGFQYTAPIDGHDLPALVDALSTARRTPGPKLIHVLTQKGHGYARAEAEPIKYHGVTPFDPMLGIVAAKTAAPPTYTQVFADWLLAAAERDPRIVVITPAMREGSGLVEFSRRYPERYFDVGIAEQHAVTLAAGLAARGLRPVVAIYSTFLQRAYDQLVHDVALQGLPVIFAVDRAGLVGPDGPTHHGTLDLSFLRCVPGLTIMTPADGDELGEMLTAGLSAEGPVVVRYPRTAAHVRRSTTAAMTLRHGTSTTLRMGERVAILSFGALEDVARTVADRLNATLVRMRFVKPIDQRKIRELATTHRLLVSLEESSVLGGAGAAVAECLTEHRLSAQLLRFGVPDRYCEHGTREETLIDAGLDAEHIVQRVNAVSVRRTRAETAGRSAEILPRFWPAELR